MLPFAVIAIAEALVGFFIYEFFDPAKRKKMRLFKHVTDLDAVFFDLDNDASAIRKGNTIALCRCLLSAVFVLANGVLVVTRAFIDLKDTLLVITLIALLPVR
jgi:hypothetical protein